MIATELIKRDEDQPVQFEVTLTKDEGIEFTEVFDNAEAWVEEAQ